MPKLSLLKSEADFAAFRKSKTFSSDLLKIRVHFRPNQNFPRFGFIISKKTLPKAAHRNLVKRRLKTALLKRSERMQPVDLLFLPAKGLLKTKFQETEEILEKLLTQGRLWKS
jgi:ribonuclease P protein component